MFCMDKSLSIFCQSGDWIYDLVLYRTAFNLLIMTKGAGAGMGGSVSFFVIRIIVIQDNLDFTKLDFGTVHSQL